LIGRPDHRGTKLLKKYESVTRRGFSGHSGGTKNWRSSFRAIYKKHWYHCIFRGPEAVFSFVYEALTTIGKDCDNIE
jgi:hypothetical protein